MKSILFAFADAYYQFAPWSKTKKQYKVAFIVHPRTIADTYHKLPIIRFLPLSMVNFLMQHFWPIRVAPIHVSEERHYGVVIAIPFTAKQMLEDRMGSIAYIQSAVSYAEKLGARTIGLGALTASVTNGGSLIETKGKTTLTTGRLYTAINVSTIALNAAEAVGLNATHALIAIIGAAGSIGSAVAQILSSGGCSRFLLIDLSDKKERIEEIVSFIKENCPHAHVEVQETLDSVHAADIIITATNKEGALVESRHVKPGVIIVDDAQPSDVALDLLERKDILVLSGGAVSAKNIHIPFPMGLVGNNTIYSCLAEALLLSHTPGLQGSTLGEFRRIDLLRVAELEKASTTLNLGKAVFQNNKRVYSREDVEHVRSLHI